MSIPKYLRTVVIVSLLGGCLPNPEPPAATCDGTPTTRYALDGNLDARAFVGWPSPDFDSQNPAKTSNFSVTSSLFDCAGNEVVTDTYFAKQGQDEWGYHVLVGNAEWGQGELLYDGSGALLAQLVLQPLSLPCAGDVPLTIRLDFGTPVYDGGSGLDGMTQLASFFTIAGVETGCDTALEPPDASGSRLSLR